MNTELMMYENYQNPTPPKTKIYSLPAHLIPNNDTYIHINNCIM